MKGRTKWPMCEMISLHDLYISVLKKIEKRFNRIQTNTPFFITKRDLMHEMFNTRVLIGKLIVLYRYHRKNPIIPPKPNTVLNAQAEIQKVRDLTTKIKQLRFRISGMPQSIDIPRIYQSEIPVLRAGYELERILNLGDHGSFKSVIVITKRIIKLYSQNYSVLLRIDKQGVFRLVATKINWPKNSGIPKEFILFINKVVRDQSIHSTNPLKQIDLILSKIYKIGQSIKIWSELKEISVKYQYWFRFNGKDLFIVFDDMYAPYNYFKIDLLEDYLWIHSLIPYYQPPEQPEKYFNVRKIFVNKSLELDNDSEFEQSLFNFLITPSTYVPDVAIKLSDAVYFTRIIRIWNHLKKIIFATYFTNLTAELFCTVPSVAYGHIMISIEKRVLSNFIIFPLVGKVTFISRNLFYYQNSMINHVVLPNCDLEVIENVFNSSLNSYFMTICQEKLVGNHYMSLFSIPFINPISKINIKFTFSPDYYLSAEMLTGVPKLNLMSCKTNQVIMKNTRETLMMNYLPHRKKMKLIGKALKEQKNNILMTQLEEKLKANGYLTSRTDYRMKIAMRPILNVLFKVNETGYWSLRFDKSSFPFFSKSKVIIVGNQMSMRFVDSIVEILKNVHLVASLLFQSRSTQRIPLNVLDVFNINELNAVILVDNNNNKYHIELNLAPFRDIVFESNGTTHFISFSWIQFTPHCVLPYHLPLSLFPNLASDNKIIPDTFGALLGQKLSPLLRIAELFGRSKNWSISVITEHNSFFLVFKKALTLNISLSHDLTFSVSINHRGRNSFLLLPLSEMMPISKPANSPFVTISVKSSDLSLMKDTIKKYYQIFLAFEMLGFQEYEFRNNELLAFKPTLRALATKNGIIFDSKEYQPLRIVTTSFNEIPQISNNVRRAFVEIISCLLLLDKKIIQVILAYFQLLLQPIRRDKFNWTQMMMETSINPENIKLALRTQVNYCYLYTTPPYQQFRVESSNKTSTIPTIQLIPIITAAPLQYDIVSCILSS